VNLLISVFTHAEVGRRSVNASWTSIERPKSFNQLARPGTRLGFVDCKQTPARICRLHATRVLDCGALRGEKKKNVMVVLEL
jgi:hypothetical protein